MVFGISTKFLTKNLFQIYDGLKLLIEEKQPRNLSNIVNEKIVAIVDNSLEHKCITTKQHKCLLSKCLN